jgi:hypothetical protein
MHIGMIDHLTPVSKIIVRIFRNFRSTSEDIDQNITCVCVNEFPTGSLNRAWVKNSKL